MVDFHLSPDKPPSAAAIHAKHIRTEAQQLMENERLCFSILSDFARVVLDWKVRYAPQSPDEPVHARFAEACHNLNTTWIFCAPGVPLNAQKSFSSRWRTANWTGREED